MYRNKLLFLVTAALTLQVASALTKNESSESSNLLSWLDTWLASKSKASQLAVLSAELPTHELTIKPEEEFTVAPASLQHLFLRYKCTLTTAETDFDEIKFSSILGMKQELSLCSNASIPFTIKPKDKGGELFLRLKKSSYNSQIRNLKLPETFSEALTLQLVLKHAADEALLIQSGYLYVWTLDAWLSSSRILVENSLPTLKTMIKQVTKFNIQLLSNNLTELIESAPQFLQPLITVALALSPDRCEHLQVRRSIILANSYYEKIDSANLELMKHAQFDVSTGKLYLFAAELDEFIRKRRLVDVNVCIVLSLAGRREPYEVRRSVGQLSIGSHAQSDTPLVVHGQECQFVGKQRRNVTILAGLEQIRLVCPILCNSANGIRFEFYRNGERLTLPLLNSSNEWIALLNGVKISRGGHVIQLPRKLSPHLHGGEYLCKAGGITANLYVSIVVQPKRLLQPPSIVFVAKNDQVNLYCRTEWPDQALARDSVTVQFSPQNGSVLPVQSRVELLNTFYGSNMSAFLDSFHSLVCMVHPIQDSGVRPQLPMYWMQTHSRIVKVPKIDAALHVTVSTETVCSWSHLCLIPGSFKQNFALQPDFLQNLNSIGVIVLGHLTLNGVPLTEQWLVKHDLKDTLDISYEQVKATLSFRVSAASVKSKLDFFSNLTKQILDGRLAAVFNYHYNSSTPAEEYTALKYASKVNYDSNDVLCVKDPTCFYSTAFESSNDLFARINTEAFMEMFDSKVFQYRLIILLSIAATTFILVAVLSIFVRWRCQQEKQASDVQEGHYINSIYNWPIRDETYDVVLFVDRNERVSSLMTDGYAVTFTN